MNKNVFAVLLIALGAQCLRGQSADSMVVGTSLPSSPSVPKYILYRHFMGWVNSLHSSPNASQSTVVDPYLFAQPFAHAQLTHANIDTLLNEAQAMAKDLKAQDDKIAAAVATFRAAARAASASGKPLPSIPPQLNTLELQRTALLVQHMVSLQTSLGATAAATLDRYLYREFAPHVSLKAFANPPSSPSQSGMGAFYGGVP